MPIGMSKQAWYNISIKNFFNPEENLGAPTTSQTSGVWTMGNYGGSNVVLAFDVVFPTVPSDGCLAEKGGSGTGLWIGLRDSGTVFRVRAFSGAAISTNPTTTAWIDISDFPQDGQTHTVVVEIRVFPSRIRLWIDGIYKGEGTKSDIQNSGSWEGGAAGSFLSGENVNVVGEPTAAWPGGLSGEARLYSGARILYNVPSPITDGVVLYIDPRNTDSYPGSGSTIFDLTTNDYDGTFQNGASFENLTFGKCIRTDGVDDYVDFSTHPEFTTSSFTVNVWFHGISTQPDQYATLLTKEGTSNLGNYSFSSDVNSNYVRFGFHDGTNTQEVSNTSYNDIKAYSWRNYTGVFTYNGGSNSLQLYRMGNSVASSLISTNPATTAYNLALGYRPNTANYGFNGRIGLVQIFDRNLSGSEIIQNFNYWREEYGV